MYSHTGHSTRGCIPISNGVHARLIYQTGMPHAKASRTLQGYCTERFSPHGRGVVPPPRPHGVPQGTGLGIQSCVDNRSDFTQCKVTPVTCVTSLRSSYTGLYPQNGVHARLIYQTGMPHAEASQSHSAHYRGTTLIRINPPP